MTATRPRRSVLYMPAANERALEKAKGIAADAIIFDLEDAVSPDAKDEARARAVAAATSGGAPCAARSSRASTSEAGTSSPRRSTSSRMSCRSTACSART